MEVSSIGAGLPLIVVGIAAIAIAGGGVIRGDGGGGVIRGDGGGGVIAGDGGGGDSGGQTTAALKCPDDLSASLPPQRVATVESGANAQVIVGPTASKTEPFGLRLTDGGKTVGAMTASFFPASGVFKVQSFVDANCHVGQVRSISEPGEGPLAAVPNQTDVRIDLLGRSYRFNLGGGSEINVNFAPFVP